MYEQFYGFSALPFTAQPVSGEFYFCPHHRRVLDELAERVLDGRCLCLLSGAAGVGKSSLVQALGDLVRAAVSVSQFDAQHRSETTLADRLLADLGLKCDAATPGAVVECLTTHLRICRDTGRPALLVVEHAERLTQADCALLGQLAASNDGEPLLQLLFVTAQPEIWAATGDSACSELAQRVQEHYPLLPLSPIETDSYIRERVAQAGGSPELFAASASEAVYNYSRGVPRLINRVCDLALVYGSSRDTSHIDAQTVGFVLNDRWGGSQRERATANVASGTQQIAVDTQAAVAAPPALADHQVPANPAPAVVQSNQTDSLLAQKLVELLKQGSDTREPAPRQVSERDLYDFIRLSLRYHQRHVERFTLGIVVGVALLAAGGLWTFITWQNEDLMPSAAASYSDGGRMGASMVRGETVAPFVADPVVISEPASSSRDLPAQAVSLPATPPPVVLQAPTPAVSEPVVAVPPTPASQPTLTATINSEDRAQQAETARLERERQRLQKELAAQRAEQQRLKKENAAERARAEQAKQLVEEARRNARAAWDQMNTGTPEAFPEK